MPTLKQLSLDYYRIEKAIHFIRNNVTNQPGLSDIAASINLSEYHFQRLFRRWTGISPKRFLQYLTKEYAKKLLDESKTVLDVSYETGSSGTGRLHDLFVACEAVTPGEYQNKWQAVEIFYGVHPSPFGDCFIAATNTGICSLSFIQEGNTQQLLDALKSQWSNSTLKHSDRHTKMWVDKAFDPFPSDAHTPITLYVKGTNFQIKVWEALLEIPFGKAVSYEDIAKHIRMPRAARAVGNAVGRNPVSFLIPCHRVIKKMGDFGNYGGGRERKIAMLGWEAAHADS
jgi:AraC family transcriptional regulator of adaptative response/methylated-DNA-[protein]-cysteine methyltransferase